MNTYHIINGIIDGQTEQLFGSFDKDDCIYELDANKIQWKNEGFKSIKLTTKLTSEKPSIKVYGKKFCKQYN